MLDLFKNPRAVIAMVYDIFAAIFSFYLAICLRFEVYNPYEAPISDINIFMLYMIGGQITFFFIMGLYKGVWRYSSTPDLLRIFKATSYGTALSIFFIFLWNRLIGVPRSVVLIDWVVLIMSLGAARFVYRMWKDSQNIQSIKRSMVQGSEVSNVLIVGAGSAGNQLIKEIQNSRSLQHNIVGVIDDDSLKKGRTIQDVKILGTTDELPSFISKYDITKIYIALPSASGKIIKSIIHKCEGSGAHFKTLPKIDDILNGKVDLSQLRDINLEDLLGREPVKLDQERLGEMISGKTVMITGSGGSIGSELCVQIAKFNPERIILFEVCEFFLYELEMKLSKAFGHVEFIPCIGDVRHSDRVETVISTYRPNLIFHAAAYKHVPMMEKNPLEAIQTNVLGTSIVSKMALKYEVEKFVMISTDKAVNPTNIMGTSKRIAEMVCQLTGIESKSTQFITVRFGNVLGSNGSVVPLFTKQIEEGGPLTVTHPEITRYFMSIPEACQLVIQAGSMGRGGEVYVLDMGEPVKITDLAKDLITLSGSDDIEIEFTGLRPGEKLYEELFSEDEKLTPTEHKKVRIARTRALEETFERKLSELLKLTNNNPRKEIYMAMKNIVSEFNSEELQTDGENHLQ